MANKIKHTEKIFKVNKDGSLTAEKNHYATQQQALENLKPGEYVFIDTVVIEKDKTDSEAENEK